MPSQRDLPLHEGRDSRGESVLWERDEDYRVNRTVEGLHRDANEKGTLPSSRRAPRMTSGFHHIALVAKDMDQTIRFYEGALGMRLRAAYPMHGIRGAKHCFLEAGNGNEISFVEFTQNPEPNRNPKSFFQVWPVGMHHHMAYRCESLEQLKALREQIKAYGTPVSKLVNHDFIVSCYFTDPSGYNLELTYTYRGYTKDEYDVTVINRVIKPEENAHAESDRHGSNVVKASPAAAIQQKSKL